MFKVGFVAIALMIMFLVNQVPLADAEFGRKPDSNMDPALIKIDEDKYLGSQISGDFMLVDSAGREFKLGDIMTKPLILVLSYYSCEGACPTTNISLIENLSGITSLQAGKDFNVLTLSFDKNDNKQNQNMFQGHIDIPSTMLSGWKVSLMKNKEDIERLTKESLGINYFWSPSDRMFVHPNVYVFLSPSGRVMRYLYAANVESRDVELALLDSDREETGKSNINDIKSLILLGCYSYNYKEGKYSINYPLFIAMASLLFGLLCISSGIYVIKNKKEVKKV